MKYDRAMAMLWPCCFLKAWTERIAKSGSCRFRFIWIAFLVQRFRIYILWGRFL